MSKTAVVTGACGLVGAEAVTLLCNEGYEVIGLDNDMRRYFFGREASTEDRGRELAERFDRFQLWGADIRDAERVQTALHGVNADLIVHAAAQPSHDWAASEPQVDFAVNAVGTLNMLEAARRMATQPTFAHISTSKVYGDHPNGFIFQNERSRLDFAEGERYYEGFDTSLPVESSRCIHSLFGVSKLSGDLLVQEYGRYFDMPTVCLRPGCVTGGHHAGAELHGFLAYLVKCVVNQTPYTVFGYDGKQVRCNIHGQDLAAACLAFHESPKAGGPVYNIGGGRENAISMMEAIDLAENVVGKELPFKYNPEPRIGDHMWWISNNAAFKRDYPKWDLTRGVPSMIEEIAELS